MLDLAIGVITIALPLPACPQYGAATGGYFASTIKIPHGEHGMHTTRLVVHVPKGVASVRPEVPLGTQPTALDATR